MEYNLEVFSRQYPVVFFFVQHLAYFRRLRAVSDKITDHKRLWASTTDGHLKLAAIAWCKVFGSRKEDTHWAKNPNGSIPRQTKDEFRRRVVSVTGLTHEQWEIYHIKMLAFRYKFVAHFDLTSPFNEPVPSFDPALQAAYAFQEWVRDLIQPVLLNQDAFSLKYEEWKAEALSIVPRKRHPKHPTP
jgi:hypothetical protein